MKNTTGLPKFSTLMIVIGASFTLLISLVLGLNEKLHGEIGNALGQLETERIKTLDSLKFSEELYHTQLEVWEYAHFPSEKRLNALDKHLSTQNQLSAVFFNEINSGSFADPMRSLKNDFDELVGKIQSVRKSVAGQDTPAMTNQKILDMEEHLDHSKFFSRIHEITEVRNKIVNQDHAQINELQKQEKLAVIFMFVFTFAVTAGFAISYRSLVHQRRLTEMADAQLARETEVRAVLLQSSKMASLGEMAGGVAHEINNPVGIIQGKASQLLKLLHNGSWTEEKGKEQLGKIVHETERIAKIVRGLRSFSRNAENDPLEPVSIRSVVDDVLGLCAERFSQHSVPLEISELPEVRIAGRASQLAQVLSNLLINSFDAVSALPEKWVRVNAEVTAEILRISVTDSGHGIPAAVADKMMQPFFSTKEVGKGTGLGLSISKGIIEDHGGKLWLDRNNAHTRFVIDLPIGNVAQTPKAA